MRAQRLLRQHESVAPGPASIKVAEIVERQRSRDLQFKRSIEPLLLAHISAPQSRSEGGHAPSARTSAIPVPEAWQGDSPRKKGDGSGEGGGEGGVAQQSGKQPQIVRQLGVGHGGCLVPAGVSGTEWFMAADRSPTLGEVLWWVCTACERLVHTEV